MRRIALALAVLAVTTPGSAAPERAAPAAAAQHQTTTQTGDATSRMATWSYQQMNNPQVVVDVLRDVASGKLPRTTVATLGAPAKVDQLLRTPWPQRGARAKIAARGTAPKGLTKAQTIALAPSEWGLLAASLASAPDVTPAQLHFSDVYDKHVSRSTAWFTANADGHVTATVPTGAPFRIVDIVSYDGTINMTLVGPLLTAWDWRKTAPFELSVRAGQKFSVMVEFAPEFAIGTMMAGQKTGQLEVKDDHWTSKVPLSGMFRGIQVDGIVLSGEGDVTAATFYPTYDQPTAAKVQLLNIGPARTVTITADALPSGVTLEGTTKTVQLAASESKWVDIRFLLTRAAGKPSWDYGFAQPITLRATAPGGKTSSASFSLNILEPLHVWEWKHDDLGVAYSMAFTLYANGHFNFYHQAVNSSIFPRKIFVDFFLPKGGSRIATYAGYLGNVNNIGGDSVDYGSYDQSWSKDYATSIQQQAQFKATISDP